ncbi:hypothetical protein [Corynebacterium variabile]|uniref:hypothetical protein n=1 Tax=Corynebacterium variabile TaxID=1727 RepID=UPI002FE2F381
MTARTKRRGVPTVPLYSEVTPAAKEVVDSIAAATGARKNVVLERIMAHVESEIDDRGVPHWWPEASEELPLTG